MARHWSGLRLAAVWVATVGSIVVLRGVLYSATYRSAVEDGRVVHLGGVWPRSFATLTTAVAVAVAVGLSVVSWLTWDWFNGRKERAARRIAAKAGHRRVIM